MPYGRACGFKSPCLSPLFSPSFNREIFRGAERNGGKSERTVLIHKMPVIERKNGAGTRAESIQECVCARRWIVNDAV